MPDKEKKEKKPSFAKATDGKPKAAPAKKAVVSDAVASVKKTPKKKKEEKVEAIVAEVVAPASAPKPVESMPTPVVKAEPVVRATVEGEAGMEDMPADFDASNDDPKSERYWEAVGRRKTAIARVRLFTRGEKGIYINEKPHGEYFVHPESQVVVEDALKKMKSLERFRVTVKVSGGGIHGQAEAVRHGIARALVKFNPEFRKRLRRAGYMTRDPRAKERKKFGLKKARRAPQWAKR